MANIESLNRRIEKLIAASGNGRPRIIWREPGHELPNDINANDDDLLIITWKVGSDDSDNLEAPRADL